MDGAGPIRIAAFAAFYGDRVDGFDEAIACKPDVLIGDYLAELTMLVLHKVQARGGPGYAAGFVKNLEPHLTTIASDGIKLITNAGGLDPEGCAAEIEKLCNEQGISLRVAAITGDNLVSKLQLLQESEGQSFPHLDDHSPLNVDLKDVLTANAYLGAWPIVSALGAGADIVICPRMTDSSLVIGPAAWRHGWHSNDWDKLAGSLAAGHLIECGTQVTGGNFSFFTEFEPLGLPGMPYADVFPDGSAIIGKAPRTGGIVTVDTVKAQLLYEIGSRYYQNPDVILDLESVRLRQQSADTVRVFGCRGLPPTSKLKVSLCYDGGYRNSMTLGLTGMHSEAKAEWMRRLVAQRVGESTDFDDFNVSMIGPAAAGGQSYEGNTAWLVISAASRERTKVGREAFSNVLLSTGFGALPGCYFTSPPQSERQIAIQWPCLVDKRLITPQIRLNGDRWPSLWGPTDDGAISCVDSGAASVVEYPRREWDGPAVTCPLATLFGNRSGDKGGTANLGVWARDPAAWAWLDHWLSIAKLKELLPEVCGLRIERHRLPNLFALNFLLHRFLGDGVSACLRIDPQAKGLGEYLGAQSVAVPASLFKSNPALGDSRPTLSARIEE